MDDVIREKLSIGDREHVIRYHISDRDNVIIDGYGKAWKVKIDNVIKIHYGIQGDNILGVQTGANMSYFPIQDANMDIEVGYPWVRLRHRDANIDLRRP